MDRPDRLDVEAKVLKKKNIIGKCIIELDEDTGNKDITSTVYANPIAGLKLKVGNTYFFHITADNKVIAFATEPILKDWKRGE